MVRRARFSLGAILAAARMPHNVVRELAEQSKSQRRRQRHLDGRHRDEIEIPTMAEIKAICEAAQGRWRPLLLTATFTGLRASELRGLEWSDVNFEKGEISVRQRADRYNKIGSPKSAAGYRTVPVPPQGSTCCVDGRWSVRPDRTARCWYSRIPGARSRAMPTSLNVG
jgi:integrase